MKLNFQKQSPELITYRDDYKEERYYNDYYEEDEDYEEVQEKTERKKKVGGFFSILRNKEIAYLLTVLLTLVPFVIMQNMAMYSMSMVWFIVVQLICFVVCKFTE